MIIGRKIIVKDEVASTNDLAKSLANEGEEEGLVVTAKTQVAGRGRMGRSWSSPEGGLYISVILRPKVPVEDMLKMTVLACVPVAETIEEASGCKATNLRQKSTYSRAVITLSGLMPAGSTKCMA